jgi:LMBR1 domain-containing protein 1
LGEFESNCILAEREFTTLDNTAQYRKKVEPCWYVLKLILGILCLLISLILIVHLFLYVLLKVDGKSVKPFLNTVLEDIENSNASFFATVLFAFIGYYFMICAIKGNVKLGLRFFCFTFYPMV